jgi:hypothetical protein
MFQKAERVAGQGNPIAVSAFLTKPTEIIAPEEIQRRCLAKPLFLQPETAATIAHLAFGGAQ